MAYAVNTLNGIIQLNDMNLSGVEGISDLFDGSSLIERIYAQQASQGGTVHKYLKQTVAAGAAFRAVSAGLTNAASQDELMTVTLALMDASYSVDKAIADAYRGKSGSGYEAYLTRETARHLRAALHSAEAQVFYGTGNDASGFAGLATNALWDKKNDTMVVDATGTDSGDICTSVWLIRSGLEAMSLVVGNDGKFSISDPFLTTIEATGLYDAWRVSVLGYLGLQLGSNFDAVRICNVTDESGKGLTDSLIAKGIGKFPASKNPNMIVMNRYALSQLQQSRTSYSPTGTPAPFPAEAFGIPIIVSDAIATSETALTT